MTISKAMIMNIGITSVSSRPIPACIYVGGNDTYGISGIPSMVGGRGVVQRAGLVVSTRIVYPGSGREDV